MRNWVNRITANGLTTGVTCAVFAVTTFYSAEAAAQLTDEESCLGVIKYSKLTSREISDVTSFREIQEEYCRIQSSTSSSEKTSSFSARWKVLGGGMDRGSSSSQANYERLCTKDGSVSEDDETRESILQGISEDAYAAYTACIAMKGKQVSSST